LPAGASREGAAPPTPPKVLGESAFPASPNGGKDLPKPPSLEKVPAPPRQEVNIRSFESDMASLQASGGTSPAPKTIRLEDLPEESPIFHPETANQLAGSAIEVPAGMGWKKILKFAGALILVVALGLVGYFVIYPIIFPAPQPAEISPPRGRPAVQAPPVKAPHQSFFAVPAPVSKDIILTQVALLDIIAALQTEAGVGEPPGTLKELAIADSGGQISFNEFLNALAPQIAVNEIAPLLEDDFTGFLYYDARGIWPGYVARLKPGASPVDAEALLARLEEGDVRLFYVADPGVHSGFQNGPYKNYPVRFAKFSVPGASFNYGLAGDYAVISSSFDGLKSAFNYLGL
jgi:hypothetical protein